MKLLTLFLVPIILVLGSFDSETSDKTPEPVVIIELFTSQGCSSCPSADKLLASLAQNTDGKEIYALSFHVSYWNRLGWKDPYSSEQFTQRQKKYGAVMNLQTIYTPQMIVNGEYEFVGSSKSKADYNVNKALEKPMDIDLEMKNVKVDGETLSFQYNLDETAIGHFLNIAIVEKSVENYVPRGENRGLTLKHENVVRQFKTIYSKQAETIKLEIDNSIDPKNSSLIVYLQDKKSLRIYGASKTELESLN